MQNMIEMYTHCRKCLETKPDGVSPSEWSRLECGFTQTGFQVWCMRCNISVVMFEAIEDDGSVADNILERKELH